MAGTRQHFIPRMLLRKFADGSDRVKVVSRERATFVASTGNVALEGKFFGAPGPGSADEAITNEEGRIGELLAAACESPVGPFLSEDAAVLFAHLAIRTRSTRLVMGQFGDMALEAASDFYSDKDRVRVHIIQHLRKHPEVVMDELLKLVRQQFGEGADTRLRQSAEYPRFVGACLQWCETHMSSGDATAMLSNFSGVLDMVKDRIEDSVRGAHERLARDSPTPAKRVEAFSAFTYETRDIAEGVVLGDSVGFCVRDGGAVAPILFNEDDTVAVVMPIARSRVLVGWRNARRPELDRESIIDGAFRTSEDFVVMHPSLGNLEVKQPLFGAASAETLEKLRDEAGDLWGAASESR